MHSKVDKDSNFIKSLLKSLKTPEKYFETCKVSMKYPSKRESVVKLYLNIVEAELSQLYYVARCSNLRARIMAVPTAESGH